MEPAARRQLHVSERAVERSDLDQAIGTRPGVRTADRNAAERAGGLESARNTDSLCVRHARRRPVRVEGDADAESANRPDVRNRSRPSRDRGRSVQRHEPRRGSIGAERNEPVVQPVLRRRSHASVPEGATIVRTFRVLILRASRGRSAAVLLSVWLAVCPCAWALNPSLEISQYAHTAWKGSDEFPGSITA